MKRTCERCAALHLGRSYEIKCNLGYDIITINGFIKQKNECPKPLTIKKFIDLNRSKYEVSK